MAILHATEQSFDRLTAKGTVVVDFYADWCGPCRMLAPILKEIADERPDLTVVKVNVDECSAIAARYGIVSIPTLIVFRDGQASAPLVGYRPKDAVLAAID